MRLKFLPFLLLLLAPVAYAQDTVTGHVTLPSGTAPSNVKVCFTLGNFAPNAPKVINTGTLVAVKNFCIQPAADGSYSTSLFGNDTITPISTNWRVDFLVNGQQQSSATYYVNHTPFNLDSEVPLSVSTPAGPNQLITQAFPFTQVTPATTWTITHNFNDSNTIVSAADANGQQIFPDTVNCRTNPNVCTLTFISATSGFAIAMHAGAINIATTQPNAILQNPVGSQSINAQALSLNGPTALTAGGSLSGSFSGNPLLTGTPHFLAGASLGGTYTSTSQLFTDWQPLSRTAGWLYKNTTPISADSTVPAASDIVFMPNITAAVNAGVAQEVDAFLMLPQITRPSSGSSGSTYSGVAIGQPRDGGGTTKYNDAAALRIESNPPIGVCNNDANGIPQCFSLAVDAGRAKFGGSILFKTNQTGLEMSTGSPNSDLRIVNLDSGASTLTLGQAAALRLQLTGNAFSPVTPGAMTLGLQSSPYASLFLGAVATNNAAVTGTFAQATTLTMPDPGGATATFAYRNIAQTWSGNQTNVSLVTPTIGGGSTINAVYRGSALSLNSAFTAITAGTCQEQTLTLTGAATTGVAFVQPTATPGANFSWSAWVSASNTISVRLCAGSTATPTSVTWNATVIQ